MTPVSTPLRDGSHVLLVRPSFGAVQPAFWYSALRAELSFASFKLIAHAGPSSSGLLLLWLEADSSDALDAWSAATDLFTIESRSF